MIKRLTITLLALLMVSGLAVMAAAQTTAMVHGDPGCAPSPYAGTVVSYTGVVYVAPGTYNSGSTYFQDADGGMTFFMSGSGLLVGDEISVTGTVDAFGDEIQLSGVTFVVNSSGNTATPVSFGTQDLADGTDQLGNFVKVQGVLAKVSSGFNSTYTVDDGSGPVIVFVDGTTGIDTALLDTMLGDIVSVQGASKCFGGAGEVLPRNDNDFSLITVPADEASVGQIKSQF